MPGIDAALAATRNFGLKHCQDAVALKQIDALQPGRVVEVGGGISRTLPYLAAKGWQCWNIDRFEGLGNGPKEAPAAESYQIVDVYMGKFSPLLENDFFDLVYSISVVEHIGDAALGQFFADIWRILKPGGLMLHAIDMTLSDTVMCARQKRICLQAEIAERLGFKFVLQEKPPLAKFSCAYASNPDLVMRGWYAAVPEMTDMWNQSQVVSLIMAMIKA